MLLQLEQEYNNTTTIKKMPHRLLNIDYGMIMLNATSLGTLSLAWFSDNLNSFGGFVVMMSVAYLNFAKARNLRKDNEDK